MTLVFELIRHAHYVVIRAPHVWHVVSVWRML